MLLLEVRGVGGPRATGGFGELSWTGFIHMSTSTERLQQRGKLKTQKSRTNNTPYSRLYSAFYMIMFWLAALRGDW